MAAILSSAPTEIKGAAQHKLIAPQIQEIVDQIVDKLYTLKLDGKSETVITLKHPPLLSGSNVVIKSFASARGEFNIAFENLTQAAKQLLDMQENQNSLRFALEQKGYVVHILTTTTLSETLTVAEGEELARDGREEQGSEDQGQGKQRQEEQES